MREGKLSFVDVALLSVGAENSQISALVGLNSWSDTLEPSSGAPTH